MNRPPPPGQERTLVIGIGNLDREDDGVGIVVARRLRAARVPGMEVIEAGSDFTALIEAWQGFKRVLLLDASRGAGKPGSIHLWDARRRTLRRYHFPCSTHGLGLADAIELARALKALPSRLFILGVEGKNFGSARGLSPPVAETARELIQEFSKWPRPGFCRARPG